MKIHLSPQEFVDALDGTLSSARLTHVGGCANCREELAALRATLEQSQQVEVPEPSPLFWDHFSARVQQATAQLPPRSRWNFGWYPLGAIATAAAALALALLVKPASAPVPEADPSLAGGMQPVTEHMDDDGSVSLLVGLATELDWSDVRQAAAPAEGTADAMIEELTPEQREVLVRLLQKEIGDL